METVVNKGPAKRGQSSTQFVAVYGTLKRGFGNHRLLAVDGAEFVDTGKTAERYPLLVNGLPYLHKVPGVGHNVRVEVYSVDDPTMATLDRLEGHPNFYCREQIDIITDSGETIQAWIYFINRKSMWNHSSNDFGHAVESFTRPEHQFR